MRTSRVSTGSGRVPRPLASGNMGRSRAGASWPLDRVVSCVIRMRRWILNEHMFIYSFVYHPRIVRRPRQASFCSNDGTQVTRRRITDPYEAMKRKAVRRLRRKTRRRLDAEECFRSKAKRGFNRSRSRFECWPDAALAARIRFARSPGYRVESRCPGRSSWRSSTRVGG
jgi:hypothetical protein